MIILILPLLPDIVKGALAEGQEEGDEHEEEAHAEYGLIELRNMIELVCGVSHYLNYNVVIIISLLASGSSEPTFSGSPHPQSCC